LDGQQRTLMANAHLYVLARRALLDAVEALAAQRSAVILCGAQAIYLHVGEADFAVSPYTSDADLMICPERLLKSPPIGAAMEGAGFRLARQPGIWRSADGIEVDLLVPEALGGSGRRGARLETPHPSGVARKVRGLEAAVLDNSAMQIEALDEKDARRFEIAVAGPAALLIAKLHKLADRASVLARLHDKDALDVLRLLRGVSTEALARSIRRLLADSLSATVSDEAIEFLRRDFGSEAAQGTLMSVRATEGLEDPEVLAASCAALTADLLSALGP